MLRSAGNTKRPVDLQRSLNENPILDPTHSPESSEKFNNNKMENVERPVLNYVLLLFLFTVCTALEFIKIRNCLASFNRKSAKSD